MNLIMEDDILELLRKKTEGKVAISVIKSLKEQEIWKNISYEDFIWQMKQTFDVSLEIKDIDNNASILDIVELVNMKKGLKRKTLRELIDDICQRKKEKEALHFDNQALTYEKLYHEIKAFATGLQEQGVRKGTHVGIILDNSIEYILMYFALFYIGAIPIPINTRWLNQEIQNVLEDSDVEFIAVEEYSGKNKVYKVILSMIQKSGQIRKVFYQGENYYGDKGIRLSQVKAEESKLIYEAIKPEDIAMISYTSGTTGKPKGIVLRQNAIVKISLYASRLIMKEDSSLSIAPLYSAQGFLSLLINFASEDRFKMLSSFNPNDIIKEISKGDVTVIHTQPTMWTMLLNCKLINFAKFDSLKTLVVSGSLCSPELAKRIEEKIGCTLINVYGLIEGTSVVTMTRKEDSKEIRYNTVGRPIPGVRIKIVDQNRTEVTKGEIGELAIQGYLFEGYYNNQEKMNQIMDADGWLYTGDLAKYYDDENISIVGRCKDMVIRGGFNVYPSDIEEIILQIPEVQSVAVVGRPNKVLGEELVAFVVPRAGITLDKNVVSRYVFEHIANYKQPDHIYLINDMPIILAGKIDKKELYQWAINGIPKEKQILFE